MKSTLELEVTSNADVAFERINGQGFVLVDLDIQREYVDAMKQRLAQKVIDAVFSSEKLNSGISDVFGCLNRSKGGLMEVRSFLKEIILENCDDSNRSEAIRVLSKF